MSLFVFQTALSNGDARLMTISNAFPIIGCVTR
jgi:hypothetical protein